MCAAAAAAAADRYCYIGYTDHFIQSFWKLGGFTFSSFTQYRDQSEGLFKYPDADTKDEFPTRPNLDYLGMVYLSTIQIRPQCSFELLRSTRVFIY